MYPDPSFSRRSSGSALVLILLAVVLVSTIVILFLSQATLSRQISFSSAGQYRAEVVARSGTDTIISDLRNEMAAGSVVTSTTPTNSLYTPIINYTVVPSKVGDGGFPNVVKRSAAGTAFWSGTYYSGAITAPKRSVAGNSTTAASANGRSIAIDRWNDPYLLGSTLPASFTAPDWVIVTRQGPVFDATSPVVSQLADSSVGNTGYAIGRYSYMVYNEGGLLDVNVAGYPTSLITAGSDFVTKRGLLPQVDVSYVPGIDSAPNANTLVAWRNAGTASTASLYTNYVYSATNGFVTVAGAGQPIAGTALTVPPPGDQTWISRQDLINYSKAYPTVISTSALQYLGTFSRELNAPTFAPSSTRNKVSATLDDTFNPSIIGVPVTTPFTRIDGTSAVEGEPLVKSRFPLSRLNWIGHNGPNGASVPQIQAAFGLKWEGSQSPATNPGNAWVYVGHPDDPNPTTIPTLSQVATAGRDPDFFELLQAGILYGSLGKTGFDYDSDSSQLDGNTYNQIIQIGANLIDQYDADSYPTMIDFGSEEFAGVENLPYLYRFFWGACRPQTNQSQVNFYFVPEIWNPHISPSGNLPMRFRFRVIGEAVGVIQDKDQVTGAIIDQETTAPVQDFNSSAGLIFDTATTTFQQPTGLTSDSSVNAQASGNDVVPDGQGIGVFIGSVTAKDYRLQAGASYIYQWVAVETPDTSKRLSFELQYETAPGSNQWVTYNRIRNFVQPSTSLYLGSDSLSPAYVKLALSVCAMRVGTDPRIERFSSFITYQSGAYNGAGTTKVTLRPGTGNGNLTLLEGEPTGWFQSSSFSAPIVGAPIGLLSENIKPNTTVASFCYYQDPDGVVRRADGAYRSGTLNNGGYPLATPDANPSSRPIVLNRPFRSVGEMGYASRDMPWKHLDFFTTESADSALLDLFCLNESPTDTIWAGKVDLNTNQQTVLEALLAGAIKSDPENTTITTAQAKTLASSLRSLITSSGPLLNRSDLVNRWIGSLPNSAYGNGPDTFIKRRREAAVRALADVGMTRTWNLLIDIVAQSGRYPSGTTGINQFVVEGEKRYWLHVALDRYTGQIVSEYMEPVYD